MVEDGHTILNGSYYSSLNLIAAQHYLKKEVHRKGDTSVPCSRDTHSYCIKVGLA